MSIENLIREDLSKSIKSSSDDKTFLRVIVGEIDRNGKNLEDSEIVKILKKMKENALMMGNHFEVTVLDRYLPKEATEDELNDAIKELISSGCNSIKDMGKMMKSLKEKFPLFDGKLASDLIKKSFNY